MKKDDYTPQNMNTHLTRSLVLFSKKIKNKLDRADDETRDDILKAFKRVCSCANVDDFIVSIATLAEHPLLMTKLYADKSFSYDTEEEKMRAGSNKLKGDIFEVFCAAFFNQYQGAYSLFSTKVAERDQEGWDFEASNAKGSRCFIQAKYVQRGTFDGSLETFWRQTALQPGVISESGHLTSVLITSAERNTMQKHEIEGTFRVLYRKDLKSRCNNQGFWNTFNTEYLGKVFHSLISEEK